MAQGFRRDGEVLSCQLEPVEQMLISSLIDELVEALDPGGEDAKVAIDPLAVELGLTDLTGLSDAPTSLPDNPVLSRLLPDAYPDDSFAAAEFRRYTDDSLRRAKLADAAALKSGLQDAAADPSGWVEIDSQTADRWLRAMNDLRLALGVQLEITADSALEATEIDEEDPRHASAMIYDFLTWWQDGLVLALIGGE